VEKLAERQWDAMLVDHALTREMTAIGQLASVNAARRIVMLAPGERHRLAALREQGFTGYLVKPVRTASLSTMLRDDAPAIVPSESDMTPIDRPTRSLSILVAEDNEINALLTRTLLTRLGHRVTVTTDGQRAVEAFAAARGRGDPFDLVLMDVSMPGLDGASAAQQIRALERRPDIVSAVAPRRPTPILALTANVSPADRDACLAAGMDGFLTKPLERERLEEVLRASRTGPFAPHFAPLFAPLAARTGTPHIVS
jgi:CheY-like chemotaxis protein